MVRLKTVSILIMAATLPGFAASTMAFAGIIGPTSEYYLTDYNTISDTSGIIGVQGSATGPEVNIKTDQRPRAYSNWAIAVDSTIRTMPSSQFRYGPGAQYKLDGSQNYGISYHNTAGDGFYDGTSDGIHNYAVQFGTGSVYQFNSDWTNPIVRFNTGNRSDFGTTYDPTNNSIWVSPDSGAQTMRDYSLSGTLLSSFALPHPYDYALALDHADNTLWITYGGGSQMEQYSKTGTLLQTTFFASPDNHVQYFGGEFALSIGPSTVPAPVPEPAFFQMAGLLGMGGLGFLKRKLRN